MPHVGRVPLILLFCDPTTTSVNVNAACVMIRFHTLVLRDTQDLCGSNRSRKSKSGPRDDVSLLRDGIAILFLLRLRSSCGCRWNLDRRVLRCGGYCSQTHWWCIIALRDAFDVRNALCS